MTNSYDNLNEMQLDALREIGNIGTANASSALSVLLNKSVNINVPKVSVLDYDTIVSKFGGPESLLVGLASFLEGDLHGIVMVLMKNDFALSILNEWAGIECNNALELDEFTKSALQEAGNIMMASYINPIAEMCGLSTQIGTPLICVDMAGSVMELPVVYFSDISDSIVCIDDEFQSSNESQIVLMLEMESLHKLLSGLGLSE